MTVEAEALPSACALLLLVGVVCVPIFCLLLAPPGPSSGVLLDRRLAGVTVLLACPGPWAGVLLDRRLTVVGAVAFVFFLLLLLISPVCVKSVVSAFLRNQNHKVVSYLLLMLGLSAFPQCPHDCCCLVGIGGGLSSVIFWLQVHHPANLVGVIL